MTTSSIISNELQMKAEREAAIKELWRCTELTIVTQSAIILPIHKLAYGNSRDFIHSEWFDKPSDYWTACEYLLLLVLAAEGEELPS